MLELEERKKFALEAIEVLNFLASHHNSLLHGLIDHRLGTIHAIVEHPTLVAVPPGALCHEPSLGMLGVINGIVGLNEGGKPLIKVMYNDESGEIVNVVPNWEIQTGHTSHHG